MSFLLGVFVLSLLHSFFFLHFFCSFIFQSFLHSFHFLFISFPPLSVFTDRRGNSDRRGNLDKAITRYQNFNINKLNYLHSSLINKLSTTDPYRIKEFASTVYAIDTDRCKDGQKWKFENRMSQIRPEPKFSEVEIRKSNESNKTWTQVFRSGRSPS